MPAAGPSLYDAIGERLHAMIAAFGLQGQQNRVNRAYELLCRQSRGIPAGSRPTHGSRLNADGTPVQIALGLAGTTTRLQFVADIGPLGAGSDTRMSAARACIPALASVLRVSPLVERLSDLLDDLVPLDDPELRANDAGPLWLGAAFGRDCAPSLKVYVNAKWGDADARWARLAAVAGRMGVALEWSGAEACASALEPLGVSVTVAHDAEPNARFYLGGYGRSFEYYEEVARASGGPDLARLLRRFGRTFLGDDYAYPTRSAVWSFGCERGSFVDYKLELCAHCAFADDDHARARCLEWLRAIDVSSALYARLVDLFAGGQPRANGMLHAYVGVGAKRGRPYSTFYFNPAAAFS
jgi:hypothetical protein